MSAGQGIGAVVGGIVGFMVAGPAGAFAGASLGMAAGGLLDPAKGPNVKGPRLDDLSIQVSTYGTDIPRIYGTIGGAGNVIQLENNKLKEKVRKKKSGGKGGGGSSETTTYSYSATFQLALCEGPIAGVRRIWCSDKLIYNAGSDDLETIIASNKAAKKWKLYLGTDDQLPDPRYEAEYGVGNVSAHRGLAYIAFYDFQLADYSNTLQGAQFKVEVINKIDSVGLRQHAVYANNQITLNETSTVVSVSDGVVSFAIDPSDPRPDVGSPALYRDYKFRLSDGNFVLSEPYPGRLSRPFLSDVNYPIGRSAGWSWSFHYNHGHVFVKIYGVHDIDFETFELTPYAGESLMGFGAYAIDGLLYVFRQRSDSSCYVEIYMGTTLTSASDIINSDGSPFTSAIGDFVYHDAAGYTPIVEAAGEFIWLVGRYSSGVIVFSRNQFGDYEMVQSISSGGFATNQIWGAAADGVLAIPIRKEIKCYIRSPRVTLGAELLKDVIQQELNLSGLISDGDIDTSAITSIVRGFRVTGGSIRSAIEPLQSAFLIDVTQSGYKIKCVPRGQSSVATIPAADLGATSNDSPDAIFAKAREMDTQLPARTTVMYTDASREYAIAEQYHERINTPAVNQVKRELALVMTADEGARVAEILQNLPWLERTGGNFSLPPIYLGLEPCDVINIATAQATHEIRLTDVNYAPDGRLVCSAVPARAALYSSNASGSEAVPPSGTVPLAGGSLFVPLDIPVIDETLQDAAGFVGVMTGYTAGWSGGMAVRSVDAGQTWADLQAFAGMASIGTARGTLPASPGTMIDQRSLTVDMVSGEPDSITRDQMLSGVNHAAYGADGRWEIVRFQNAALQADGSYILSGFVRGDRGTEWATGLHSAGDYFVLLDDPDTAFIGMAVGSIGVPANYRGITSGGSLDDASDVPFTYHGVNLEPLSAVDARGARDTSGNFTGTFRRRSRLSSSWWANGVEAPVGEVSQSYEIDVMNGSTVVRTIAVSAQTFSYSAADQTTDFGSAQASITFRIYQLSATVGRGYQYQVTL